MKIYWRFYTIVSLIRIWKVSTFEWLLQNNVFDLIWFWILYNIDSISMQNTCNHFKVDLDFLNTLFIRQINSHAIPSLEIQGDYRNYPHLAHLRMRLILISSTCLTPCPRCIIKSIFHTARRRRRKCHRQVVAPSHLHLNSHVDYVFYLHYSERTSLPCLVRLSLPRAVQKNQILSSN